MVIYYLTKSVLDQKKMEEVKGRCEQRVKIKKVTKHVNEKLLLIMTITK